MKNINLLPLLLFVLAGCTDSGGSSGLGLSPLSRTYSTDVLIFDGTGTAASDAQSLAALVEDHGLTQRTAGSEEINGMSVEELSDYGVIVWPGGYANQMTGSLTLSARRRIQEAVHNQGVSYSGFCAGAWMAVGDAIPMSGSLDLGFALLNGGLLDEYLPFGPDNYAMQPEIVPISFPDGTTREVVWYGSPVTPDIGNGVLARYRDGRPAITQAAAGNGFVVLSGVHPEAPENWKSGLSDGDGSDYDLAWKLVEAALLRAPLRAF